MKKNTDTNPHFSIMYVVTMHQINDLLRHTAEVEDGRVRVKASGMELVAVLHG